MKNKITIIIVLIAMFCSLNNVKADMGDPGWDPYWAWVVNRDGIDASDFHGMSDEPIHIPYGARVYVWNGGYDAKYSVDEWYVVRYGDGGSLSVSGADIRPLNKTPKEEFLTYEENELVFDKDVNLFKGPDSGFGKVTTIKEGSKVTSTYNDGTFAFVNYEGQEGWVYFKRTDNKDKLPNCYVLNKDDVTIDFSEIENTLGINEESEESLKLIGEYKCDSGERTIVYQYGDIQGTFVDNCDTKCTYNKEYNSTINEQVVLYGELECINVVGVVNKDSEVKISSYVNLSSGKKQYYCSYADFSGWTNEDAYKAFNALEGVKQSEVVEEETYEDVTPRIPQIVYYTLAGVFVVSLSALVVLRLVNKNK